VKLSDEREFRRVGIQVRQRSQDSCQQRRQSREASDHWNLSKVQRELCLDQRIDCAIEPTQCGRNINHFLADIRKRHNQVYFTKAIAFLNRDE
jgi:hypothetical protein